MNKTIVVDSFYTKDAVILVFHFLLIRFGLIFLLNLVSNVIGINMLEATLYIDQLFSVMILLIIKFEKIGADGINQLMQGPKDFKLVIWLMVLAVGDSILMVKIYNITSLIMPGSTLDSTIANAILEMSLLTRVVVLALLPSFCEELLFRGVITKRLAQSYSEVNSIVLSAILFAAFHLSLRQMIPTFLGGVLFGFVYIRTKNIYYPMLLHFFYNLVIILSFEVINRGYVHRPVWFTVVGIVFVGVGLLQVMKRSSVWCNLSKHA